MPKSNPTLTPLYAVLRNGEPIHICKSISTAHPKRVATDIMLHLQAVTDDDYSLELTQWVEAETADKSCTDTWETTLLVDPNRLEEVSQ